MIRKYFSALLVILLFTIGGCTPKSNNDAEKLAIESAQAWLEIVDSGKYTESWEEAAEYFKSAVTKEEWETTIHAVRNPFGKVGSRMLKSQKYTTSLPGTPYRDHIVIQYNTTFDKKKAAVETITLIIDKDGKWKMLNYDIKNVFMGF